jgi:hypothetical protein
MTTETTRRRGALPYLGEPWMYEASKTHGRILGAAALLAAGALSACGGGGGSHSSANPVDPLIQVVGPTGRYSMTPAEANSSLGAVKPPLMPPATQNGQNQYVRFEVPFAVRSSDIMSPDPIYGPFSHLIGNLSITDETGRAVPGIPMVNGFDAFGKFRGKDVGFPHDLTAGGQDRNLGVGVILYVADDAISPDGDLDSIAAFGGSAQDSDALAETTEITPASASRRSGPSRSTTGRWATRRSRRRSRWSRRRPIRPRRSIPTAARPIRASSRASRSRACRRRSASRRSSTPSRSSATCR